MKAIPKEVRQVVQALQQQGFEAYVVGGCVRDLLLGRAPDDWDVTTNAKPEEIQQIFPKTFYENKFFTVTVQTKSKDSRLKEIEVTTYRADFEYGDRRRPGRVEYAKTVKEDLSRRDFTVNAIALGLKPKIQILDPFNGKEDLKRKIIRAVGRAEERFQEDALRMIRAVRIATILEFQIDKETERAIQDNARLLKEISQERIRDELIKIIMAPRAAQGIELLQELGLLKFILQELQEGVGVKQNKHHRYTVWEHNVKSLEYAAKQGFSLEVRLAALLHDVGKPRTKRGDGPDCTFYGHQIVGSRMAKKMLEHLRFPRETIDTVTLLVKEHMFVYDPEVVTLRGVRRLVARVGPEHIDELFEVREADRIGSGVPKAQPYRLRHLRAMVEKVRSDPISPKMLKINGDEIMGILHIPPGPPVGAILAILLEEVLDDPKKNTKEFLRRRAQELGALRLNELQKLGQRAQMAARYIQERIDREIKQRYFVK